MSKKSVLKHVVLVVAASGSALFVGGCSILSMFLPSLLSMII